MDQNSPEYSVIMAPNTNQTMIPQHTQSNYSPSPTSSITSTSMMMNSSSSPLKDLFVGNLSFFCQEKHLKELFSKYGEVANIRIKRNDKGGRSLMYGFISMATTTAAQSAAINLHQQLFMGRNIRVELSSGPEQVRSGANNNYSELFQLHLSMTSNFENGKIVYPTEELLRSIFEEFGDLVDITVKEYIIHRQRSRQEGYGFVTYSSDISARKAAAKCGAVEVQGVRIESCLSFHNPKPRSSHDGDSTASSTSSASPAPTPALEPSMYYVPGGNSISNHPPVAKLRNHGPHEDQLQYGHGQPPMRYSPTNQMQVFLPSPPMPNGGQMPMNMYSMAPSMQPAMPVHYPNQYFQAVETSQNSYIPMNMAMHTPMSMSTGHVMMSPIMMQEPHPMYGMPQIVYDQSSQSLQQQAPQYYGAYQMHSTPHTPPQGNMGRQMNYMMHMPNMPPASISREHQGSSANGHLNPYAQSGHVALSQTLPHNVNLQGQSNPGIYQQPHPSLAQNPSHLQTQHALHGHANRNTSSGHVYAYPPPPHAM